MPIFEDDFEAITLSADIPENPISLLGSIGLTSDTMSDGETLLGGEESDTEQQGTHRQIPGDVPGYELVVVGAGVTGLYILREILKSNPKLTARDVLMIESGKTIGGRIWTDKIVNNKKSNMDNFVLCEEGAMRICVEYDKHDKEKFAKDQVMPRLVNLIKELKEEQGKLDTLPIEPFPMIPEGRLAFNRNNYNGESFTSWYAEENPGIYTRLFGIKQQEEIGKSPGDVYQEVYIRLLRANIHKLLTVLGNEEKVQEVLAQKNMGLVRLYQDLDFWYEFRRNFQWNNIPIYQYSMRGLLRCMNYSAWIIKMLEDTSFECFIKGDANAGIVIQMERTHAAMESNFSKFSNGFSDLVFALKNSLNDRLGVNGTTDDTLWLKRNCRLQTIRRDGMDCELVYQPSGQGKKEVRIHAKRTVLAVPRKAIEKIRILDVPSPTVEKLKVRYNSVTDVNMTKINLYFDRDWWNDNAPIPNKRLFGNNTTSLPLSMVYPWYTTNNTRTSLPATAALTIYCDMSNSAFWSQLQSTSISVPFSSKLQIKYKNQFTAASSAVVQEALFQLGELFNVKTVPWPLLTSYTCWGCDHECPENPVAIHQWRPGSDDRELRKKLSRPFEKCNLYVSNEAWSEFQGWVEGSLQAADYTLDLMRFSPI